MSVFVAEVEREPDAEREPLPESQELPEPVAETVGVAVADTEASVTLPLRNTAAGPVAPVAPAGPVAPTLPSVPATP